MLEQKSYASASHISCVEYELKANPTKKKFSSQRYTEAKAKSLLHKTMVKTSEARSVSSVTFNIRFSSGLEKKN